MMDTAVHNAAHPVRVVCVDDNADVLRAITYLLGKAAGVSCVGSLTSCRGLADAVGPLCPEVVLLDYSMPGESPLDELRDLKRRIAGVACIVFSGYSEDDVVAASVKAGAACCLPKDADIDVLVAAIRRACPAPRVGGPAPC